ncbi:MAG TPA: hypothetical protein VKT73_13235 [Xanthobacteraceae bacterium]|nr:hypothetical protein [Xanthobacteraceae bacterium]
MAAPMEKMVAHVKTVSSAWGLDFPTLVAGLIDMASRIEKLEADVAAIGSQLAKVQQPTGGAKS